jgi:hypothetical protein
VKAIQLDDLLDDSEYEAYRMIILEETKLILSNKSEYIHTKDIGSSEKLTKLEHICDFFYLEDEYTIRKELNSLIEIMLIKHLLKDIIYDI